MAERYNQEQLDEVIRRSLLYSESSGREGNIDVQNDIKLSDLTVKSKPYPILKFKNSKFTNIEFINCEFSTESSFIDCEFKNCSFENCDFSGCSLMSSHISDSMFQNVKLNRTKLNNTSITKSLLNDVEFDKSEFYNTDFTNSDLSTCKKINSQHFKISTKYNWRTKLPRELRSISKVPSLKEVKDELVQHDKWLLTRGKEGKEADFKNISLQGLDLKKITFNNIKFESTDLTKVDFSDSVFVRNRFTDAIATSSDFRNASFKNTRFDYFFSSYANYTNANFEECIFDSSNISYAFLLSTKFNKCKFTVPTFKKANFYSCTLENVVINGGDFEECNLAYAKINSSSIDRVSLKNSSFEEMLLFNSNLTNSDLTDAEGLKAEQLGGNNLLSTRLPVQIDKFKALDSVKEISLLSKGVFFTILILVGFNLLTILATSHEDLLTNSSLATLPLLPVSVPMNWFYLFMPVFMVTIFLYFLIYLQRLWETFSSLPAVFPDGAYLDKRSYPWILNGFIKGNIPKLNSEKQYLSKLQYYLSIILIWFLIPILLFFFCYKYLVKHDFVSTTMHNILLSISITLGVYTFIAARNTFNKIVYTNFKNDILIYITILVVSFFIPKIIFNTFTVNADFQEKELSKKPELWSGKTIDDKTYVKSAIMREQNIEYANARYSFIVGGDFRNIKAKMANFTGADLRFADFSNSDLRNVNFDSSDVRFCNFTGAVLDGSSFIDAIVDSANFSNCSMKKVIFDKTTLNGAIFNNSVLKGIDFSTSSIMYVNFKATDLSEVNIKFDQIRLIVRDSLTKFSNETERRLYQDSVLIDSISKDMFGS